MKILLTLALVFVAGCGPAQPSQPEVTEPTRVEDVPQDGLTGTIHRYTFPSAFAATRTVDVWLPPDYDSTRQHVVLYMHDGQNLHIPSESYGGVAWEVDEAMAALRASGEIPPTIVVGLWNTPLRFREYMPQRPVEAASPEAQAYLRDLTEGDILSDGYLRHLVEEVKPFIDANYPTLPDAAHTFVAGSSMGGLISMYAQAEYPQVFGGMGAFSTHWPIREGDLLEPMRVNVREYLASRLDAIPPTAMLYFDYGTAELDAYYPPYQAAVDSMLVARGISPERWVTRRFEGAGHNEAAWQARFPDAIRFLFSRLSTPQ